MADSGVMRLLRDLAAAAGEKMGRRLRWIPLEVTGLGGSLRGFGVLVLCQLHAVDPSHALGPAEDEA
jgi:hypothetical protein